MAAGAAAAGCSSPEARGVGLLRPGRSGHRGGRIAFLYFEHTQLRFTFPEVLLEEGGGRSGLQDRSGDVGGISDKHVVVLAMLGIGELGGVRSRLGLRLLEAVLDVVE